MTTKEISYQYEHEMIKHYSNLFPDRDAWHWSVVPEDLLFECGYIHDYNKTRQDRLRRKKELVTGQNRVSDYGFDGLSIHKINRTPYSLQAKAYNKRKVTASDIGSFLVKQTSLRNRNPSSVGYLYTFGNLEINLKEELLQPDFPIKHIKYHWTPSTTPIEGQELVENIKPECDIILREDQQKDLEKLLNCNGLSALVKPCGTGKTTISGYVLKNKKPHLIIAIAPLKSSVENLEDRLPCFLPEYKRLLVDSDYGGTTDEKEIMDFLAIDKPRIIFSTFKSTQDLLSRLITEIDDKYYILVDEVHNINEELCNFTNKFKQGLVMSAVIPYEVTEMLNIETTVKMGMKEAIDKGYIVDYTLWLPHLTNSTTIVDLDKIPEEFSMYKKDLVSKAMYNAVCMLKTGSRRCIVYLTSCEECDLYMTIVRDVFEKYHGCEIWCDKIDSNVSKSKRKEILTSFETGENYIYHILPCIRILDEAVDIPKCDSVFITSIGEHSSDIRMLQRSMRSARKDVNNPNKHNNIFLWTEDINNCVYALDMIKESDHEFHKKIRMVDLNYDNSCCKERIDKIKYDTIETIKWIEMSCMTLFDKVNKKVNEFMEWVKTNNQIPPQNKTILFTDKVCMGSFWGSCKSTNRFDKKPYDKLLELDLLKEDYDKYLVLRESKIDIVTLTPEDKVNVFMEWVKTNNQIPPQNKTILFTDKVCMGSFWGSCKSTNKFDKKPYNKLLELDLLKEDYDKCLVVRESKVGRVTLTPEDKVNVFMEWVKKNNKIPPINKTILFTDKVCMGAFWVCCKTRNRFDKKPYNKLLELDLLKEDYDKCLVVREGKVGIVKLTPEDKVNEFMEWVKTNNQIPPRNNTNLFTDKVCMGSFWGNCKSTNKFNKKPYNKLLELDLLKEDYDKCLVVRESKVGRVTLTPEDKVNEFMEWVKTNNQIPPINKTILFTDKACMGSFWACCKSENRFDKKPYNKLLELDLLKEDYDKCLVGRESKVDIVKLTPEDKVNIFMEWVKTNNNIPPQINKTILFTDKACMGAFWACCKARNRIDKKPYNKLLELDLLKDDYDKFLVSRESKVDIVKLTPEDKVNIFMEWVETNNKIPPINKTILFTDKACMGEFWCRCKSRNKFDKKPYNKLLELDLLKEDYDKCLVGRESK
jgi:superfamily II DNA or RNA helicase/DNA gyrase inhibitor GyrI